jgi:radical SAM protein with 4Fe4S-binding SPASM domain
MFSSAHGVIIGPDGNIYKCISLVGRDEFSVGNVRDDDYDRPAYDAQLDTMKRIETCFEERCAYVPVCAGGCAYESIVRTGRYELRFCTKDYLAEYHFKRSLVRHRDELEKLGARPLTAADLRAAERPPLPPSALIPVSKLTRRTPVAPQGE